MHPVRRNTLAFVAAIAAATSAPIVVAAVDATAEQSSESTAPPVADAAVGDAVTLASDDPTCPGATTTTPTTPAPESTDPGVTDPAATDPAASDPASTDPAATDPPVTDPDVPTTTESATTTTIPPADTAVDVTTTTVAVDPCAPLPPESTTTVASPVAPPAAAVTTVAGAAPTETSPVAGATEPPPAVAAPADAVAPVGGSELGVPALVDPLEPVEPLPPTNPTWSIDGPPRVAAPRTPGAGNLQPGRTPIGERVVVVDDIEVILATIRQFESGERYGIGPNRARASGAYQYIPSTWSNYGGYPEAYLAPPEVQDARARSDVQRVLALYGGDVSMVPVMWYYPRAASDPSWMDRVPNPAGGNRLTIREYQYRWLQRLTANVGTMLGTTVAAPESPAPVSVLSAVPQFEPTSSAGPVTTADPATVPPASTALAAVAPVPAAPVPTAPVPTAAAPTASVPAVGDAAPVGPAIVLDEITVSADTIELAARSVPARPSKFDGAGSMRSIVFPVLGPVTYADGWGDPRDDGRRVHVGTDIIGVRMQPILAAVDGVVTRAQHVAIGISGVAVAITDADGWRYNYFHGNNDTPGTDDDLGTDDFRIAPGIEVGTTVVAGQIIGYMGDSGNSEGSVPHLHFEFRDPSGTARPSYWSLQAAEAKQACTIGLGPWSTPWVTTPDDVTAGAGAEATLGQEMALGVAPNAPVEHTVITPLYGEGQWVIDSEGRVTATGDAALIIPDRELRCDAGPATTFGTDAGGWAAIGHDALDGTVLEGAALTGTVLGPVIPPAPVDESTVPAPTTVVDPAAPTPVVDPATVAPVTVDPATVAPVTVDPPTADPRPLLFDDPATGEKIVVVLEPSPIVDRLIRRLIGPR